MKYIRWNTREYWIVAKTHCTLSQPTLIFWRVRQLQTTNKICETLRDIEVDPNSIKFTKTWMVFRLAMEHIIVCSTPSDGLCTDNPNFF